MARLSRQDKENRRKAFMFLVLTGVSILAFLFFGLPAVAKFAAFLTDIRTSSTPVEREDETPPPPPKINTLPSHTNEKEVEISGNTEAGATVLISVNGTKEELLANNQGSFIYTVNLSSGENTINAISEDRAGNKSRSSEIISIIYDDKPPELEITKPEDQEEYFGSSQRQIVVEGTTEEGVKLLINNRQVVVEADGTFAYATTLSEGTNEFAAKAQDKAGNITEKSISVTYNP